MRMIVVVEDSDVCQQEHKTNCPAGQRLSILRGTTTYHASQKWRTGVYDLRPYRIGMAMYSSHETPSKAGMTRYNMAKTYDLSTADLSSRLARMDALDRRSRVAS
jgi:hypothetical protein